MNIKGAYKQSRCPHDLNITSLEVLPPNLALEISPAGCGLHGGIGSIRRGRDDSDVATGVNYGVASSSSWCKSVCHPETGMMRTRGPLKITASFQW